MTSKDHSVLQTGKIQKYPYLNKVKYKDTEDKILQVSVKRQSLKKTIISHFPFLAKMK